MRRIYKVSSDFKSFCFGFFIVLGAVVLGFGQSHEIKTSTEISTLEFGKTIEREISGGQRHSFKIRLKAGQFIKVEVEQTNCDIMLSLQNPDKINIFEFKDDNFRNGPESGTATAETENEYELRLSSFEAPTQKGNYSLKIAEIRQATDKEVNFTSGLRISNEVFAQANPNNSTADASREGIERYKIALEKFRLAENLEQQAIANNNIASLYSRLGDSKTAIIYQSAAVKISTQLGGIPMHPSLLSSLSVLYLNVGEPQAALDILFQSLKWTGENSSIDKARALNSIGLVYEKFGSPEKSVIYYEQAFQHAENLPDKRYATISLNSLGKANFALGNYQKASDYFQKAIELSRTIKNRRQEAASLGNLAQTFYVVGDKGKVDELLNEALIINRSLGDKIGEAAILRKLGQIALNDEKTGVAYENFTKSIEIYRSIEDKDNLAVALLGLAKTEAKRGNFNLAQNQIEEAISSIEKVRSRLQNTDLRDSFSASLKDFYGFYVEVLMERAKTEPNKNFAELALKANERASARGLLNLLTEGNANIREGVEEKLIIKETELRNLLAARLENLTKVFNGKFTPEQIEKHNLEIHQIRIDYEQIQTQIRQTSPRYAALTQPNTLNVAEIQQKILDEDSVLLEYSLGETKSFLWVVTKNSFQTVELPKRADIEHLATLNYEALTARNKQVKFETADERQTRIGLADADVRKYSKSLSQVILKPVENILAKKRLLIVADGALQYVPFASLVKGDEKFLVETNEIVNLPSASVLAVLRNELSNRKLAPKTLAILADPVFSIQDERVKSFSSKNKLGKQSQTVASLRGVEFLPIADLTRPERSKSDAEGFTLSRLPFTRREADSIASLIPANQRKELLDFNANRTAIFDNDMANYRFIHFATHSFINTKNPELSGIVLSLVDENGKSQDGFLRISEVFNLKMPAELVVLSGCRTGLGKEIRGEGLMGLTRGFMYSGAKRVAVSLWDVNDEATSVLMANFYREMLGNKQLSPAGALRQAQITMIKDKNWKNPYYWSTFVLQGEPK